MMLQTPFKPESFPNTVALKNAIHGPMYQVNVIIACMLDCYENDVDFSLMSEHSDFEKFDDIVFKKAGQNATQVIQIKHGKELGVVYEINDFARDTGKGVELPMYFDAWFNIIERIKKTGEERNYEFILYSNHTISREKKFECCFSADGRKFLDTFITHDPENIDGTSKITKPPKNLSEQEIIHWHSERIFRTIFQGSKVITNKKLSQRKAITWIRAFLQAISFRLGQPGLEELVKMNKVKLKNKFNINNDAIYFAWYSEIEDWLRRQNVKSHTLSSIKNVLGEKYEQFYTIQRWFALTQRRLENLNGEIGGHTLARTNQVSKLKTKTKLETFQVVIVEGEPGSGKSVAVKQYYQEANYQEGDMIWLDLQEIKEQELVAIRQNILKIIVLDNIDEALYRKRDREKIINILSLGKKHNKKIIFICQSQEVKHLIEICKAQGIDRHSISKIHIDLLTNQELQQLLPKNIYTVLELYLMKEISELSSSDSSEITEDESSNLALFTRTSNRSDYFWRRRNNNTFSFAENELIRTPFYLNLIFQRWEEIRSRYKPERNLSNYIIKLAVEGKYSEHPRHHVKGKHRVKVLTHLVITLSQEEKTSVSLQTSYQEALAGLIKDRIITRNGDASLSLGHQIYKNWVVQYYANQLIKEALMESQHPFTLIKRLDHAFLHHTIDWIRVFQEYNGLDRLFDIEAFQELYILESEYELKHFNQFDFVKKCIILAIILNKPKILKPLCVGSFNLEDALNKNLLTCFDLAIDCNNRRAMEILAQSGVNVIKPKPMVFSVDDRVLFEYTDDPFYETDLEDDIFEIYELY
ncbi:MAG: hypothetical protein AB7F64_05460, partial [Gammaproteobacteria bacterium]